jgi:hypothetical protein
MRSFNAQNLNRLGEIEQNSTAYAPRQAMLLIIAMQQTLGVYV